MNLKQKEMKKLFCVVIAEAGYLAGLESPIVYHVRCENSGEANDAIKEMLVDEYGYDPEIVKDHLDVFSFEVTENDIIDLK